MSDEGPVFVLTDLLQPALEYAEWQGIARHRLRIIQRPEQARGLHRVPVIDVSTDWEGISDTALANLIAAAEILRANACPIRREDGFFPPTHVLDSAYGF